MADTDTNDDPLHEVRERFAEAEEYWGDDRKAALDDIKFRAGSQWPEDIVAQRQRDKRPCLTVDKVSQYIRQIVNDGRQNRPGIDVRPVDSGADIATAEVFQGIIRHIEDRSGADAAYDTALDHAATCGFGYFRVTREYAGDSTFDQELVIQRIRNQMSVLIDPNSTAADASDMKYAFVFEDIPEDDFEERWPGKKPEDFADDTYKGWYGKHVRVAEYWCVEEKSRMLYLMRDGKVINDEQLEQLKAAGLLLEGDIIESRDIPERKVMRAVVSGAEYLEEPVEWLGKYIPVFVVWGNEIDIEGKVIHSGIVRPAKDAMRLYNYSRSAYAERVALTPKAPWVAAEGQIEDYADDWNTANTDNHSVLRYRPQTLAGSQVPPPQRTSASDIPAGFAQDMQIAEHDIQAAIGMYNASVGAPSNERSGKAIMARQKEGDVGTFHYHDNLNRAIRHCGRVLVDLIPKIYKGNRVIRILGYDGTATQAQLNPDQQTASQKMGLQMYYKLDVGTYDVTVTSGPSYNTLRSEAAESMAQMVQANPQLMGVVGDLLVKNMDWPGAQEISKRLELALAPEIRDAMMKEKQDKMPPEMQQAVQQFEQAIQQKDAAIQQATTAIEALHEEIRKLQDVVDSKDKELLIKAKEAQIKQYAAETDRIEVENKAEVDAHTAMMQLHTPPEQPKEEQAAPAEPAEPAMDVAQIISAIASMQQPINITVPVTIDGKGASVKQGKAVRQPDGSYIMQSVETPVEQV